MKMLHQQRNQSLKLLVIIPNNLVKKTSVLELILPQKKPFNFSKNEDDAKLSYEVASVLSYTMQLFWPHHAVVGVALLLSILLLRYIGNGL